MKQNAGSMSRRRGCEIEVLTGFGKGLQALDTHMHTLRLTVDHQRALHDVGAELPIGVSLRKAYIVSVLRAFAAYFTLSHLSHLFCTK
jgi:hypothetical protein